MMKVLSAPLPVQYQTLAEDSKQSEVGKQFAEFIKLQQETSKKATSIRYSFELYVAEDRFVVNFLSNFIEVRLYLSKLSGIIPYEIILA